MMYGDTSDGIRKICPGFDEACTLVVDCCVQMKVPDDGIYHQIYLDVERGDKIELTVRRITNPYPELWKRVDELLSDYRSYLTVQQAMPDLIECYTSDCQRITFYGLAGIHSWLKGLEVLREEVEKLLKKFPGRYVYEVFPEIQIVETRNRDTPKFKNIELLRQWLDAEKSAGENHEPPQKTDCEFKSIIPDTA